MKNLLISKSMRDALVSAYEHKELTYGHNLWFAAAFHHHSPVICRAQTAKALVKLGYLETIMGQSGKHRVYRITEAGKKYIDNYFSELPKDIDSDNQQ